MRNRQNLATTLKVSIVKACSIISIEQEKLDWTHILLYIVNK